MDGAHLLQRFAMVLLRQEVDVPGGDDAHQLAEHFARLRNGNAGEAVSDLGFEDVAHRVAWTHHHWVCDETLLESLGGKIHKITFKFFTSVPSWLVLVKLWQCEQNDVIIALM